MDGALPLPLASPLDDTFPQIQPLPLPFPLPLPIPFPLPPLPLPPPGGAHGHGGLLVNLRRLDGCQRARARVRTLAFAITLAFSLATCKHAQYPARLSSAARPRHIRCVSGWRPGGCGSTRAGMRECTFATTLATAARALWLRQKALQRQELLWINEQLVARLEGSRRNPAGGLHAEVQLLDGAEYFVDLRATRGTVGMGPGPRVP